MANVFDEITGPYDAPVKVEPLLMGSQAAPGGSGGGLADTFRTISALQEMQLRNKKLSDDSGKELREQQAENARQKEPAYILAQKQKQEIVSNPLAYANKVAKANGFDSYAVAPREVQQLVWDVAKSILEKDKTNDAAWAGFSTAVTLPGASKKALSQDQTARQLLVDPIVGAGAGTAKGLAGIFLGLPELAASNISGGPTVLGDALSSVNKGIDFLSKELKSDAFGKTDAVVNAAMAKGDMVGVEEAFEALKANPSYMAQFVTENAAQFLVPGGLLGKAGVLAADGAKLAAGVKNVEMYAALGAKVFDWAAGAAKTGNLAEKITAKVIGGVASNSATAAKVGLVGAGQSVVETNEKAKQYLTSQGIDPKSAAGEQFILQAQNSAAVYAGTVGAATTLVLPGAEGLLSKVVSARGREQLNQGISGGLLVGTGKLAAKTAGTAAVEAGQEFVESPATDFGIAKAKGLSPNLREIWAMGNPVEALLGAVGGAGTKLGTSVISLTAGGVREPATAASETAPAVPPLRETTGEQVVSVVNTLFSTSEGNTLLGQLDAAPGAARDAFVKQAKSKIRAQVVNEVQTQQAWNDLPTMAAKKQALRDIDEQVEVQFTAAAAMAAPEFKAQIADLVQSGVTFPIVEGGTEVTIKDTANTSPILDAAVAVVQAEFATAGAQVPYERVRSPAYATELVNKIKANIRETYIAERTTPDNGQAAQTAQEEAYQQTKAAYEESLAPDRPTSKSPTQRVDSAMKALDTLIEKQNKGALPPQDAGRKAALRELLATEYSQQGDLDPATLTRMVSAMDKSFTRGENISAAAVGQIASMRAAAAAAQANETTVAEDKAQFQATAIAARGAASAAAKGDTAQAKAALELPMTEADNAAVEASIAAVETEAKNILATGGISLPVRKIIAKKITDAQINYLVNQAKDYSRANDLSNLREQLVSKEGGDKPAVPKPQQQPTMAEAAREIVRRVSSRAIATPNSGESSVSSAWAEIRAYFGDDAPSRMPLVQVVATGADAPRTAKRSGPTPQAYYDPATNEIFLIASEVQKGTAVAVLLHEFGHKNLEGAIGKLGVEQLRSGVTAWKNAPEGSNERRVYDGAAERAADSAQVRTPTGIKVRRDIQESELIPYAIEIAQQLGINPSKTAKKGTVASWLAQVNKVFSTATKKLFSGETPDLSVQDLLTLADGAAGLEFTGAAPTGSAGEAQFSMPPLSPKRVAETNRAVYAAKTPMAKVAATTQKVAELNSLRGAYTEGGLLWLQKHLLNAIDLRSIAYAWRGLFTINGENIIQTPVDLASTRSNKIREALVSIDEKVVYGGKSLVKLYQDNQGAKALWRAMDTATAIQYNPAVGLPSGPEQAALRKEYAALSEEQKAIFKTTLGLFRDQWKRTVAVLKSQVVESGVSSAQAQKITAELDKSGLAVYFAQERFGNYVNKVKNAKGETLWFSRHESNAEAIAVKARLDQEYRGEQVSTGVFQEQTRRELDGATQGYINAVAQGLQDKGIYSPEQISAIEGLMAEALVKVNVNKTNANLQRRKNIAGASPDGFRANIAALRQGEARIYTVQYQRKIQEAVQRIRDYANDPATSLADGDRKAAQQISTHIATALNYRADGTMSGAVADALTTYGFIHTMWGNVSTAIINATSLLTVGVTTLGARFGYRESIEQMSKAVSEVTGFLATTAGTPGVKPTGDLAAVYNYARETDMIQYGDARDIYDIASASGVGAGYFRKAIRLGALPIEKSEEFTNLSILLSAYRMAKRKGASEADALTQARDMRWQVNPANSSENKSLWARTPVGRVMMQFKGYGIAMSTMMYADSRDSIAAARAQLRGEVVSEESKIAAKRLAGVVAMFGLLSGVVGVPFLVATPMLALAYGLAGGFGDEEELPMADYLKNVISEAYGEAAMRQVFSGVLGEGVSSRISLDNLLFDTKGNGAPAKQAEDFMHKLLGPAFGGLYNGAINSAKLYTGEANAFDAMKVTLPAAIANVAKSYELYTDDGMVNSKAGNPLLREPLTNVDMLGQMIGLRPAELAFARDKESAIKSESNAMDAKRRLVLGLYRDIVLLSQENKDSEQAMEIYTLAKDVFNARYPEAQIDAKAEASAKKRAMNAHDEYLISLSDKKQAYLTGRLKWAFKE
jgi:hypothetical protein